LVLAESQCRLKQIKQAQEAFKFNVSIKPWAKLGDVGWATSELNAAILERFRASQIEIPLPQREIRILKEG
jgi:small-conductance mechanosensitive channel